MSDSIAMTCEKCGAPMQTRRKCDYCGTCYYVGPEIPASYSSDILNYFCPSTAADPHYGASRFLEIGGTSITVVNRIP